MNSFAQERPFGVPKFVTFTCRCFANTAATPQQTKPSIKRRLKRRNAIEPIGHSKQDHTLGRNFLQGTVGDCINALLVGYGFNLRKLYRFFEA